MSRIFARRLAVGVAFALLASSVGLPSLAQSTSAKPGDFFLQEWLGGTLGAFAGMALSRGGPVELSIEEKAGEFHLKVCFHNLSLLSIIMGVAGVATVGYSQGVKGNLFWASIGALGAFRAIIGLEMMVVSDWLSSLIEEGPEAVRERFYPHATFLQQLFYFLAPPVVAFGATVGYNIGAKMRSESEQASTEMEFTLPLFSLQF